MRAFLLKEFAGPAGLVVTEMQPPKAGPKQVLVSIRAVSLNYRDVMVANGKYGAMTGQPPFVPLSDGAGEVVAIGAGVTRFKPGDRVMGSFFQGWVDGPPTADIHPTTLGAGGPGMLAEQVVLNEEGLVALPEHLSFVEGAGLPCAGVTAWNAIRTILPVQAGETVLIQGSGGVSIFTLQLAVAAGAKVYAISGSDEKREKLAAMGAVGTVSYRATPDWEDEIARLTHGYGIDLAVDVGGAQTLERTFKALRPGGRISQVGVLTGRADISPSLFRHKQTMMRGISVGSRSMLEALAGAMEKHDIHPVIDRIFGFDDAPQALAYLASGAHFGKVCISVSG